ncbi:MAG: hypothetical protein H8E47_09580 [Anaerolineales bacterium]|nr:hypothetical protein [Anaerolineales bacterium]
MSVKELFEDRSHEEIEEMFDTWAGRDFEDLPLNTFFAVLEEIGVRCLPQRVEMESEVVGDRLVFIPPEGVSLPFTVHGNEIILGDYTIRVRLRGVRDAVSL